MADRDRAGSSASPHAAGQRETMPGTAPLQGIVVLDLTQIYNGPYATFLLAAAGAEVIKIEPPDGEQLRKRTANPTAWLPYAMLNSGKKSLRLDLKTEEGRDILLGLVDQADVLVENFAVGVMDRLGLGREELKKRNPALIYASSSGYGSYGPYRDYPAMDLTMQAMCGIMSATGFPDAPPVKAGPAICDFLSGIHLYGAVVTAIAGRARNGHVPSVEVSMMEASYFSLSSSLGMVHKAAGNKPARTGNRHGGLGVCPYNVYPAADGYIAIITVHDGHWRSLTEIFGAPELGSDQRYAGNLDRVARMEEVDAMVAGWTSAHARDELFETLVARNIPCAPVRDLAEVIDDPHLHARGSLQWIDHPEYGRLPVAASPLRFDDAPSMPQPPSVGLGSDGREILSRRLGMDERKIDALAEAGVI